MNRVPQMHPNFLRGCAQLLYWALSKPWTLRIYLGLLTAGLPRDDLARLPGRFRQELQANPALARVLIQAAAVTVIAPALAALPVAGLFAGVTGKAVDLPGLALGVTAGVIQGVLLGAVLLVGGTLLLGAPKGFPLGVAGSVGAGVLMGVAWGLARGAPASSPLGEIVACVLAVAVGGVAAGALGVGGCLILGIGAGIAVALSGQVTLGEALFLCYLRAPLWVLYLPWQLLVTAISRLRPARAPWFYRRSPARLDEVIWLPLPGLSELLLDVAHQDTNAGWAAVDEVSRSPLQRQAARRAAAALSAGRDD